MTKHKYQLIAQSDPLISTDIHNTSKSDTTTDKSVNEIINVDNSNRLLKIFLASTFILVLIVYNTSMSEQFLKVRHKYAMHENESTTHIPSTQYIYTTESALKVNYTTVTSVVRVSDFENFETKTTAYTENVNMTYKPEDIETTVIPKSITTNDITANYKPTTAVTVRTFSTMSNITATYKPTTAVTIKTMTTTFSNFSNINAASTPKMPTPKSNAMQYYVRTTHCRMPYVNPFTPQLRKIFKPKKYSDCASDIALVNSIYDASTRQYHLHLNTNITQKYTNSSDDIVCCYRQIVRTGSGSNYDKNYKLLPCSNFHQDFVVPTHIDAMIVDCNHKSTKKLIQQDAFSFIQYKNETNNEAKNNETDSNRRTNNSKKPSVLLIGIDSLSRINFRRNMPKTFEYLEDSGWYEMQGYNKMGDNTYPNLMALLLGYNETTAYKVCQPKTVGGLSMCNFIWKNFKASGYRTAYAEDTASISTFNYLKKGFAVPPTDYYLRPMMLAIERKMKVKRKNNLPYCVGRKHYGEYIYDYALQLNEQYAHEPLFGLFWTNSFSHNSFDTSATMDIKMLQYLQTFEKNGILEKAIVIFFSDHGCRWGPLLNLPEGFLEERLPMFFISLPTWFKQQHSDYVQALQINRNRLTSPYDIHMTLRHILQLYEPSMKFTQQNDCSTSQSIFHEIAENRTCNDACITEHWCTCIPYEIVAKSNAVVKTIGNLIVDEMNKYIALKNLTNLCSTMKLSSIDAAKLKIEEDPTTLKTHTYRIKYTIKPNKAKFQATALYDRIKKAIRLKVEDISRLNLYANDSKCIEDKEAKKYCICKK